MLLVNTRRCPVCGYVSMTMGHDGDYGFFYCKNFRCKVERIYGENRVMVENNKILLVKATKDKTQKEK